MVVSQRFGLLLICIAVLSGCGAIERSEEQAYSQGQKYCLQADRQQLDERWQQYHQRLDRRTALSFTARFFALSYPEQLKEHAYNGCYNALLERLSG